jgi:hypothetical protein
MRIVEYVWDFVESVPAVLVHMPIFAIIIIFFFSNIVFNNEKLVKPLSLILAYLILFIMVVYGLDFDPKGSFFWWKILCL